MRIIPSWDKSIFSRDSTYFGAASLMGLKAQNTRRLFRMLPSGKKPVKILHKFKKITS